MTWQEDIGSEITRLENYRTKHLQDDITRANQPASKAQESASNTVKANFLAYQNVNKRLAEIIKRSTPQDLGSTLSKIGSNQQKVAELQHEIALAKSDLDTAKQRDTQIQLNPPQISNYQGISIYFGLVKPIHMISISFLFGISIFLLICTFLLAKENFLLGLPSVATVSTTTSSFSIKDPRILGTLLGASCIVILFLSLKVANKLPILPS